MRLTARLSFFTPLYAIFVSVFVSAQMYAIFQESPSQAAIYNILEAVGAISMGLFSDKFCRKKSGILTHGIGLGLLLLIFLYPQILFLKFFLAFFYNPLPILRAGLLDNFTRLSRLVLLMLSFIFQFLPWSFYNLYLDAGTSLMMKLSLVLVFSSFLLVLFFFKDKRDKKFAEKARLSHASYIHPSSSNKLWYTVLAFICMQSVYFLADNLQATEVEDPAFYSVISASTTLCVLLSVTFKDITHSSVLRVNYGINAALSFMPLLALYVFTISSYQPSFLIVMLSGFGAFILPFVYDIVMNSINANYRGTGCGILDFIFSLTSLFSASFITFVNIHPLTAYIVIAAGLCAALYFQTKSERPSLKRA